MARKEWFAAGGTRQRRERGAASMRPFERAVWALALPEGSPENPSPDHTR